MSLYLYHATDINNVDSIMSKGLLKNPGKHNWEGMYTDDGVYLAFDADVAESYAETADVESEEIVILKIPLDKLDQDYIEYDWNNRCEYVDDINSCVYRKDIPSNIIEITTSDKEPSQDIHDFEGTDMYEWILQTFDEEVETNKEVWGERMNSFMKLTINEGNVLGMGGGWPNLYLPKDAKQYLSSNGFERVNTELGPCFYMRFTGNEVWEIYVTEEDGAIYVVQEGNDPKQTDRLTLIDDRDYRDDINALINLGNCLSNGEDFNYCIDAFFRGDLHTESISRRNKYFKEDLESDVYHDAQKAVYDFFMKKQWDLNNPEVANYADAVTEQLELDPEFTDGTYTMRDWYKDTYWSYPEEIEWLDSTAY